MLNSWADLITHSRENCTLTKRKLLLPYDKILVQIFFETAAKLVELLKILWTNHPAINEEIIAKTEVNIEHH